MVSQEEDTNLSATMTIAQHMAHVYQYGSSHRAINPDQES
jgi:hypothetical protein